MPTNIARESSHMTLDALRETAEFQHLTPKMAGFVLSYLQGLVQTGISDPTAATLASYNCKSPETARVLGCQLLVNFKIVTVMNRFFGTSPERAFLQAVERAVYKRKLKISQIRALELQCRANGWACGVFKYNGVAEIEPSVEPPTKVPEGAKDSASPATKFYVGQRVTQRDDQGVLHTGIVREIDADGTPTSIEEVG